MRETYEFPRTRCTFAASSCFHLKRSYNFSFENFQFSRAELNIELAYEADFMDVFQVRGVARENLGHYYQPIVRPTPSCSLCGLDGVARETIIHLSPSRIRWMAPRRGGSWRLPPFKRFQLHTTMSAVEGKRSARTF